MDYSGYTNFPFPDGLDSEEDKKIQNFFYALPDDEQLKLLNGSGSYEDFHGRIVQVMK